MNLAKTLLSRHGKISGRAYWINCAILLCAGVVLHLLAFGFIYAVHPNMMQTLNGAGMMAITYGLISLLLYPYFCLYTKRLRDIGVSGYWYLAVLFAYCVLFYAIVISAYALMMLMNFLPSDLFLSSPLPGASETEIVAGITSGARKMLITVAISEVLFHAVAAIAIDVVLGKMKPKRGQTTVANNAKSGSNAPALA